MTVFLAAGSVFDPIYNALGWVLAFFYGLVPNLGVAIILLTLSIMVVLYPLTAKQAKSIFPDLVNCQITSPVWPGATVTMFGSECSISGNFFISS